MIATLITRYRASGLNLAVSAIVLWNTVYLDRVVKALRDQGKEIDEDLLVYLSLDYAFSSRNTITVSSDDYC